MFKSCLSLKYRGGGDGLLMHLHWLINIFANNWMWAKYRRCDAQKHLKILDLNLPLLSFCSEFNCFSRSVMLQIHIYIYTLCIYFNLFLESWFLYIYFSCPCRTGQQLITLHLIHLSISFCCLYSSQDRRRPAVVKDRAESSVRGHRARVQSL